MIDRCHLFIFCIIIYLIYLYIYIFYIYLKNNFIFYFYFYFILSYYCISDIVVYLIYIDFMRKRFQLINVDVDILQKTVVRCPWIDKAWNTTNSPKPVERFRKTSLFDSTTSCKASSWYLLSLSNPKTSHSFINTSSAIFSHAFARDPRKNSRVTSSNVQGELTSDVTEIFLGSVSKTVFFGGRKDNKISGYFCRHYLSARAFVFFGSSLQYKGMAYPGHGYGGVSKELVRYLLCCTNQSLDSGLHK